MEKVSASKGKLRQGGSWEGGLCSDLPNIKQAVWRDTRPPIARGPAGEELLIPGRPWGRALVSARQSATPALCFPEWLPSQGQGHLLTCWAWCCLDWSLCLWPHTLTAASPACWAPWSCCWPCSQGSPPCPAGHLVCRDWEIYMPSCSHSSTTLSEPPSILPWEMCGWAVGSTPVPHFQVLWDPQLQSSQQPREAKYCERGVVWADTFRECVCGPS